MIVSRRCARCLRFWEVESKDKNSVCPKCRSTVGRSKQKAIQKSIRKKAKREAKS